MVDSEEMMRTRVSRLFLVLVACSAVMAQPLTSPVSVVPDCLIFFDRTSTGTSAVFDNRFIGCDAWKVNYTSTGFTALSIQLEHAPDVSGAPGTWQLFGGTVIDGANPSTATDQAQIVARGYFPWLRVNLTVASGSGRVRGSLYGYRTQAIVASLIGLSSGLTVTANQGSPSTDANRWPVYLSDGTSALGTLANPLFVSPTLCRDSSALSLSSGTQQIVTASPAQSIYVCHFSASWTGPVDFRLVYGGGTNCSAGTTALTGTYPGVDGIFFNFSPGVLVVPPGNALCVEQTGTATGGGTVIYVKR